MTEKKQDEAFESALFELFGPEALTGGKLSPYEIAKMFWQAAKASNEPDERKKAEAWDYYQGLLKGAGFSGVTDLLAEVTRLRAAEQSINEQDAKDDAVIAAAKNLVKVKGRHHSELAMTRLIDAVAALSQPSAKGEQS